MDTLDVRTRGIQDRELNPVFHKSESMCYAHTCSTQIRVFHHNRVKNNISCKKEGVSYSY
jgi:hypothetical protein